MQHARHDHSTAHEIKNIKEAQIHSEYEHYDIIL